MSMETPSSYLWVPRIKIVRSDGPDGPERVVVLVIDDDNDELKPPPVRLKPQD